MGKVALLLYGIFALLFYAMFDRENNEDSNDLRLPFVNLLGFLCHLGDFGEIIQKELPSLKQF